MTAGLLVCNSQTYASVVVRPVHRLAIRLDASVALGVLGVFDVLNVPGVPRALRGRAKLQISRVGHPALPDKILNMPQRSTPELMEHVGPHSCLIVV
jgi:hypothetical protein